MTLIYTSYLNVEMEHQIKRLSSIREAYSRIVQDEEIMKTNPVSIDNRIQSLALGDLRRETKDLKG